MYPVIVPVCTVIVLSLSYFATDMTPKKTTAVTDRVTAKKAKAYIYGVKEIRKLAAVKETNRYVAQYMASCPKDEHTSYIIITSALTVVFRLTVFVLYLYMVWTFINN